MTTGKTRSGRAAARAKRAATVEGPMAPVRSAENGGAELVGQTRGSIYVEYIAILVLVTLGGMAALISLGTPLVHYYRVTQLVLGLPVP